MSRELVTTNDGLGVRDNEGLKGIHTDILHVDILDQSMEHLTLSIAHIILKFGEQRNGCCSGHGFEHILLPVLSHSGNVGRDIRREVGGDHLLLAIGAHHSQHLMTIGSHSIVEFLTATTTWSQHHLIGCLHIFLVTNILHIAVLAVGLDDDGFFQVANQIVERVTHLLHQLGLIIPLLRLLRVCLHLHGKLIIERKILQCRVLGGAVQTLLDNGEAVEHLVGDIQR